MNETSDSYHAIGPGDEPVGVAIKQTNEGYNTLRELQLDELNRPTEGKQVGGRRRRLSRRRRHVRKTIHRRRLTRRQKR